MTVDFAKERLFKACAYCGLTRLMSFYGRRWLCDSCATEVGLRDPVVPHNESLGYEQIGDINWPPDCAASRREHRDA